MPDFWKDMPEPKHGYNWRASVIYVGTFTRREKVVGYYNELQLAYVKARWRALWADFFTAGASFGIDWQVTKLKDEDGH